MASPSPPGSPGTGAGASPSSPTTPMPKKEINRKGLIIFFVGVGLLLLAAFLYRMFYYVGPVAAQNAANAITEVTHPQPTTAPLPLVPTTPVPPPATESAPPIGSALVTPPPPPAAPEPPPDVATDTAADDASDDEDAEEEEDAANTAEDAAAPPPPPDPTTLSDCEREHPLPPTVVCPAGYICMAAICRTGVTCDDKNTWNDRSCASRLRWYELSSPRGDWFYATPGLPHAPYSGYNHPERYELSQYFYVYRN